MCCAFNNALHFLGILLELPLQENSPRSITPPTDPITLDSWLHNS